MYKARRIESNYKDFLSFMNNSFVCFFPRALLSMCILWKILKFYAKKVLYLKNSTKIQPYSFSVPSKPNTS